MSKLANTNASLDITSSLPTKTGMKEIDTLFNKGKKLVELKKYDKAAETFSTILKQKPDHFAAIEQLGLIARELKDYERALLFFKALTDHMPTYPQGYGYAATTLMDNEKYDEAITYLKKVNTLGDYAFSYHGLGHCYRYTGKQEEAKTCFLKAMRLDYDQPKLLYSYLMFFHDFKNEDDEYLQHAHALLKTKKKGMNTEDIAALYTILYKAYEDIGDYDKAIRFSGEAGKVRLRESDYNISANEQSLEMVKKYFDSSFFENTKTTGNKDERPVFILAMPRSGTTLLEQILHSHKDVVGIGEDGHFGELLESRSVLKPHNDVRYMYRRENLAGESWTLKRIAENHLSYLDNFGKGAERIVDKAISHYTWVGMLYLCFPNARFIHITRDPLSSAISSYTRNFVFNHHSYTNDLYKLGTAMRIHYEIMEHWKQVLPVPILDVSYESIVEDTETQAKRIIEFLDLPWDENCLNFHKTKKVVKTASADQVRKKIYKSSLKTWQKYEKHLAPLVEGLGKYAPADALYILEKYGKNNEHSVCTGT